MLTDIGIRELERRFNRLGLEIHVEPFDGGFRARAWRRGIEVSIWRPTRAGALLALLPASEAARMVAAWDDAETEAADQ